MNITQPLLYMPSTAPLTDIDIITKYCGYEDGRVAGLLISVLWLVLARLLFWTLQGFFKEDSLRQNICKILNIGIEGAIIVFNIYIGLYYLVVTASDPEGMFKLVSYIGYPLMGFFGVYVVYMFWNHYKNMEDRLQ